MDYRTNQVSGIDIDRGTRMKLKCIIFGASKTGNIAYRLLKKQYEVVGFADNNSQKWGQLFCEKEIFNPDTLGSFENVEIIIASVYYASIYKQLREQGINNIQVFFYMGSANDGISNQYRLFQLSDMLFQNCKFDRKNIEKIEEDFSNNYPLIKREKNVLLKQTDKKKILFCAYIFPPIGGSGVQRSLKFVKYLREFGYEPIVLTVGENDGKLPLDEGQLQEIPKDISVVRIDVKAFLPEMLSLEDQQAIFNLYCGVVKSEKWIKEYCDFILNVDNRLIPDSQMIWVNECLKQTEPFRAHEPRTLRRSPEGSGAFPRPGRQDDLRRSSRHIFQTPGQTREHGSLHQGAPPQDRTHRSALGMRRTRSLRHRHLPPRAHHELQDRQPSRHSSRNRTHHPLRRTHLRALHRHDARFRPRALPS